MREAPTLAPCPRRLREIAQALVRMLLRPTHEGWIEHGSRVYTLPLPHCSTRLAALEQRVVYLTLGTPDLSSLFSDRAELYGWIYAEQLGAAHVLTTNRCRLTVLTQKCSRFLTA